MITLYHCVSARSFRPLWALEEIGMPYQLRMLPFPPRVLRRGYLEDNPLGTVPLLLDGASRLTESAAICQFLACRYAPALAVDSAAADYADWLNWLHFGEATLTFPQTLVLRYGRFESPERRQPQVVTDYTRWFLARLRAVEAALEGREYLCRQGFTVADISVGYALMLAHYLGLAGQFPPAVAAYWARLQTRPAYLRALARQRHDARDQGIPDTPSPLAG